MGVDRLARAGSQGLPKTRASVCRELPGPRFQPQTPEKSQTGTVISQWSLSEDSPHCSKDQLEHEWSGLPCLPSSALCTSLIPSPDAMEKGRKGAGTWKTGPFTKIDQTLTSKACLNYWTWINLPGSLSIKPSGHLRPYLAERRYNIWDLTACHKDYIWWGEKRGHRVMDLKRSWTDPVTSPQGGTVLVARMVSHIEGEEWKTCIRGISGENKRIIHCFSIIFLKLEAWFRRSHLQDCCIQLPSTNLDEPGSYFQASECGS